eukprot:2687453-Pyramimonas_sp.AAC.1
MYAIQPTSATSHSASLSQRCHHRGRVSSVVGRHAAVRSRGLSVVALLGGSKNKKADVGSHSQLGSSRKRNEDRFTFDVSHLSG